MRRILTAVVVVSLVLASIPAFAAQGRRGASDRALERASDEAIFHRVTDWFATRGKPEGEKKAILAERKAKRAAKRAQKEAEKQKRTMEKKARKAQKKMKEKMKGFRKK
jgi:hypothetical protein